MSLNRIRGTTPELITAARRLRQSLTPAEQTLWQALQNRQLGGLRFRCQHPLSSFIADFYCPACKLIIELDGDIHDSQQAYDAERTQKLNQLGYRVLRFSNEAVLSDLETVLERILAASRTQDELS
jgi:very-short-patch-repair endonuclease